MLLHGTIDLIILMYKGIGVAMTSGNVTIHKNRGTQQNGKNMTMHKNTSIAQQGNATKHKRPNETHSNEMSTKHKNSNINTVQGMSTKHRNPNANTVQGMLTKHKNSNVIQSGGTATMHKNQIMQDQGSVFKSTVEAYSQYQEYLADYNANRAIWMENQWSDIFFSKGSIFQGYEIIGKLVKKNDTSQTVGTESVGIYKGTNGTNEVVIKILNKVDEELEKLEKRTIIPVSNRNPNIASYYEIGRQKFTMLNGFDQTLTYEIAEFCGSKTLEDLICHDKKKFDSEDVDKFIKDMVSALDVMQENKIFHSDLKPSNIIYNEKKNQYMIIDFGTARIWTEHSNEMLLGKGWTESFKAPELSDSTAAVNKADFYSLGQILFYIVTGGYLSSWVLPEDEKSEQSGNRRISLTEYVKREQIVSKSFARLYDGLSRRDAISRYGCDDIRDWLDKRGVEFAGDIYNPNDMNLYEAMGNNWEEAKKFLFQSTELREAYDNLGKNNEKSKALQRARTAQRTLGNAENNATTPDVILGKFLLEVQSGAPVLRYKGKNYLSMEDFADTFLSNLRDKIAWNEKDIIAGGLLEDFSKKLGKEKSRQQTEYMESNKGNKSVSDIDSYHFCYNVLKKTSFCYAGTEYTSKEELFQVAKKMMNVSYDEYMRFCEELNKNEEFKAWSRILRR